MSSFKETHNVHVEPGGCYALGGGATINKTVKIYINKLIIIGSPGNYDIQYTPTLFQKFRSLLGLHPSEKEIKAAIRHDLLGEKI
jgi:hypothetical protein